MMNRTFTGFCILFILLGILNIIFVHIIPGVLYIIFSLIYSPIFKINIHPYIKLMMAIVVLWGTMAVGDLFELSEAWMLN